MTDIGAVINPRGTLSTSGRSFAMSAPAGRISAPIASAGPAANGASNRLPAGYLEGFPPLSQFPVTTAPGKYICRVGFPVDDPAPLMPYVRCGVALFVKRSPVTRLGAPADPPYT